MAEDSIGALASRLTGAAQHNIGRCASTSLQAATAELVVKYVVQERQRRTCRQSLQRLFAGAGGAAGAARRVPVILHWHDLRRHCGELTKVAIHSCSLREAMKRWSNVKVSRQRTTAYNEQTHHTSSGVEHPVVVPVLLYRVRCAQQCSPGSSSLRWSAATRPGPVRDSLARSACA